MKKPIIKVKSLWDLVYLLGNGHHKVKVAYKEGKKKKLKNLSVNVWYCECCGTRHTIYAGKKLLSEC